MVAEWWVRIAAKSAGIDPGLARWRAAWAATVSLGGALVAEYFLAPLFFAGRGAMTAMLIGGVAAMQGSAAVLQPTVRERVRFALWQPVAAATGLVTAVLVRECSGFAGQMVVCVLVTFVAVVIRRFGAPYAILGLLGWAGYYMATVFRPVPADLPYLLWAELIAGACTGLLSLTVFRHRPRASLGHAVRGWHAQAEAALRCAVGVLEAPGERRRAGLRRHYARLSGTALTVEGWLAHPTAASGAAHAASIRRELLESQHSIDVMVGSVLALSEEADASLPSGGSGREWARARAVGMLRPLTRGDHAAAREEALLAMARPPDVQAPPVASGGEPDVPSAQEAGAFDRPTEEAAEDVRRLAGAVVAFADSGRNWHVMGTAQDGECPDAGDFAPVVVVGAAGALPGVAGTMAVAMPDGPQAEGARTLGLPTRYAIQAALAVGLAIVLGYLVSPEQYFWSIITVFIILLGPTTRSQILVKGVQRAVGTLLGCLAAIPLAALLHGGPAPVICVVLVSCLLGHYLTSLSYAYLAFFITVSLFQLYDLMHQYEPSLVPVRLTETLLGTVITIAVTALILPVRAHNTVALERAGAFHAIGELLDELATTNKSRGSGSTELHAKARAVDDSTRRLAAALAMRPSWTRPSRARVRSEINQHRVLATRLRELSVSAERGRGVPSATRARVLRGLAHTARTTGSRSAPMTRSVVPGHQQHEPVASVRRLLDALPPAHAAAATPTGGAAGEGPLP
ncbi:FUSC family protein [Streptomyces sp. ITFR-16]|uniref:FUSC family protein n=1 Tax=Streptomyces sp. ITFR-16 TaxID=3075198 RepID=UPI00288B748A|nr:FUSC family protein [Streptomyces sp. ITFR-16]WNI21415.1 FUSC family protein [Streptomyces sp. ITFR-16]